MENKDKDNPEENKQAKKQPNKNNQTKQNNNSAAVMAVTESRKLEEKDSVSFTIHSVMVKRTHNDADTLHSQILSLHNITPGLYVTRFQEFVIEQLLRLYLCQDSKKFTTAPLLVFYFLLSRLSKVVQGLGFRLYKWYI